MKSRRAFIASVASGSLGLALAKADPAAAQASPAPVASGKPPSAAAVACASAMRRFDPSLSDTDVQTIAKAIDANNDAARALNPKKKRLKNADAPIVRFAVAGGEV